MSLLYMACHRFNHGKPYISTAGFTLTIDRPAVRIAEYYGILLPRPGQDRPRPGLAADLRAAGKPPAGSARLDATLAAAVAAQATAQALTFIDRPGRVGAVTSGTPELVLPAWQ